MHAYAFVDPVFFALDSIGRHRSSGLLDQFCIECHSPLLPLLGEKMEVGGRAALPPIAHEGITCDACHKMVIDATPPRGVLSLYADSIYRGPIPDPVPNDFHQSRYDERSDRKIVSPVAWSISKHSTHICRSEQIQRGTTLSLRVELSNTITGHNIPTGSIFERQMWVECLLIDQATGDTIFLSGDTDPNGDLRTHHSEYVQQGLLPIDSQLIVFRGVPLRNGKEIPFFWEADAIYDRTIPPFETRMVHFRIPIAPSVQGPCKLRIRLLFRSFPPYLLRKIGLASLIPKLVTFEMERFETIISVR